MLTSAIETPRLVILDDDPSVVARGSGGDAALLTSQRRWTLAEGLPLEAGQRLAPIEVAYETWGTLNRAGDNAILVCHALTGDAHAAGRYADDARLGWWDPLIGPGRALDTRRYFVVCANILGGCQGTTGPASLDSATGQPYGSTFPTITVRDMVRLQYALVRGLGVRRLAAVAGGSLGGMQALEWLVMYPDFVAAAIPVAASLAHTPQGIAYNLIGREAIMRDPDWRGGDYYSSGRTPEQGLALARMIGMITYQSDESMQRKFGRSRVEADPADRFQVESYLHYQGESLVRRFDANSYLVLSRAMDLHDVGTGRGGMDVALACTDPATRTLVVGISSDILFPLHLQRDTAARLQALARPATYAEIRSPWGHDAFLIDYDQLTAHITAFLAGDGSSEIRS